jgi:hypothetical protein
MEILQVDITFIDGIVQVIFADAKSAPPYRIENQSYVPLVFQQKNAKYATPAVIYPGSHAEYAWDDLTAVG